jgi:PilZ domain
MTRRRSLRRPRRLQVHFWKRGDPQVYPGYTTNISLTGMFLATNSPQAPGSRLRIEVTDGARGFMVEGVVAHARKIRGDMMRMSQPGMGIRFLPVEELVRELVAIGPGEVEEIDSLPGVPEDIEPLPPPPPAPPPPPSPPPPAAAPPPRTPQASIPTPSEGIGVFSVHFLSPQDFLEVYRRDIVNGGLFVSTRYPGRLQEIVQVELHLPLPSAEPVAVRARVVQRFDPQGEGSLPNLLAGMGVELLDLAKVLEALRPIVASLTAV